MERVRMYPDEKDGEVVASQIVHPPRKRACLGGTEDTPICKGCKSHDLYVRCLVPKKCRACVAR